MSEIGGILSRVSRNTVILTSAQIVEKVINFFIVVLLARHLGAEVFGQYGFASSFVLLFNVFVGLGFAVLCNREISRRMTEAPRILTAALVPMIFSSLMALAVIGSAIYISKSGQLRVVEAVMILALEMIANNVAGIFDSVTRANERMLYSALPSVLRSGLILGLYAIMLPLGIGLTEVCGIVLCSSVMRLVLHVLLCRRVFGVVPSSVFDGKLAWRLLKESYPMALTSMFIIIYYKIDAVMLSYMRSDTEVGLYSTASALAFGVVFIAGNFQQAVFPALTKLYMNEKDRLGHVYRESFKYLGMLGMPLAVGLCVLAPRIIMLVYGERYLEAAPAMQVLTGAMLFMFVNGLMGYMLIAVDGQKIFMKIVAAGALLNVVLNIILIPRYGITGAAVATVVAEANANIACWIVLKRVYKIWASPADLTRSAGCCAAMSVFTVFAGPYLPLPALIAASALFYAGLLYASGAIGATELALLKRVLRRNV